MLILLMYIIIIFTTILSVITYIYHLYLISFIFIYLTIALFIVNIILINNKIKKTNIKQSVDYCYEFNDRFGELYGYDFNGKLKTRILTDNEYTFFYQLKRITDKYNLLIFPKLRMADIFSTSTKKDFGKVNSKHIDFTICNWYSKPILFIELDDNSHNRKENKYRDMKKDKIFECMNIKLYRVKLERINLGLYEIEKGIKSYLYTTKKSNI